MRANKITATVAAAALALTGCAQGGTSGAGGNGPLISIVSKGFQQQFWQTVKKGAEQEAAAKGARTTFVGPPTEQDVEQQLDMLTTELAKSPQALGFAALDSQASAGLLKQFQAQHIPVVAFDSGVDSDIPVTTVATNNKAAAGEAAKHLADELGGHGKVAMVVHDQTSLSGKDRRDGFLEWMHANAPGITVLEPQYGGGDQLQSANITKSIIQANPDLKGIYATNEGSAVGAIKGVEEAGKTGAITIAGFDSSKAQIDAITSGVESGAVTQDPADIGKQLVDAALKAINGEQLPKHIDTAYYWYDKTNINDPKIQASLYQ